jgi:hypothetical protein
VTEWAAQGRPGTRDLSLAVWPRSAGTGPAGHDGLVLLDRPNAVIELGWPRS